MRDVVIELGELPAGSPGDPERVLPRAPVPYRWIMGFVLVVLVALLGGSGPPPSPPPGPAVLPATMSEAVLTDGATLFTVGPGEPLGAAVRSHTIRSYGLPGLNPLGTYTVSVRGDIIGVHDGGDGLLLVSHSDNESGEARVVAVRPGGGQPVWQRPVAVYGVSPDHRVVVAYVLAGLAATGNRPALRGIDPRTGAELWSVVQPENGQITLRSAPLGRAFPDLIYVLNGDGRLEIHDVLTGRVTATGRYTGAIGSDTSFWAVGGVLMIGRAGQETVAFDDRTLAERWRTGGPVLPQDGYPQDCGPAICVAALGGLSGLDPATGRTLWQAGGFDSSETIGDKLLVSSAGAESVTAVLDPRTGRTVAKAGNWTSGGAGPAPGTAYVYRLQQSDHTVRYGVLDLGTGRVRPRGVIDRVAGDCQVAAGSLLCRRLDFSIAVQRL